MRATGLVAAWVCAASLVGCSGDDTQHWYLGPIQPRDAGTNEAQTSMSDANPAEVSQQAAQQCHVAPISADSHGMASLRILGRRAVLTTAQSVHVLAVGEDGCPDGLVGEFAEHGVLPATCLGALPLSVNRLLVAYENRFEILGGTGKTIGSCPIDAQTAPPRLLTATGDDGWTAGFRAVALQAYQSPIGATAVCSPGGRVSLSPAPFAVMALASTQQHGWVTAEQRKRQSRPTVSIYDEQGRLEKTSIALQSGDAVELCSGTSVTDSPAGIWIADGACHQVVLLDRTTMNPIAISHFDAPPVSVVWAAEARAVLVVTLQTDGSSARGGVVRFATITPES